MTASGNVACTPDPASVIGKEPPIDESTDLLVIGAGPAGVSAALGAAQRGVRITLVDENPVPLSTMGEDVPLHFGGRMAATVANRNALIESILEANPALAEAVDAGVDVRLGTAAWGLFPRRATCRGLSGHVAGLQDIERAYLMRFRAVIVAAGRRDMGLAFEGWQCPGVMGASAAYRLARSYRALEARTAVLLGAGTEALQIAEVLLDHGVRIAAVVEQAEAPEGPAQSLARLSGSGTRVLTRHVIERAVGDVRGVTAVSLAAVDERGCRTDGTAETIDCDTVLLGVAAIPAIELLEAAGCAVGFREDRGGHVPLLDGAQRTSVPCVYAAGDCAGIWRSKTLSEATARLEGAVAARAALAALGLPAAGPPQRAPVPDYPARDVALGRLAWVRAAVQGGLRPGDQLLCQCEEVTSDDILSLRPPRYLGWLEHGERCTSSGLAALGEVVPDPDAVKRLTRAGMGVCQGRRCREQIAALLALASGSSLARIPLATYRPPVRPVRLGQMADLPESPAMAEHWQSWFGIVSQWLPFWRVPAGYTTVTGRLDEPVGGE